jgi:hypothetical protein
MDQAAAKQQVVERIKQANNILVTVANNPSVDQLAACIGMTLFLNKLEKHATAVYSGKTPSVIEFLHPEKTLEPTTDSLRDFIISLDKSKADKLRYKVEDKFVRIYITPYRTSISEKDLIFEQGDFNIDVVLALGVRDKTQLDAAITQHGRILHDATIISINAGPDKAPALGQVNWQEPAASSLCEMLVSISEAFGTGLIDNQMATAFLTGIVAETERFSNSKTSPKVMTMAAQLMAAGANQQLIVSKLEPPPPPAATKEIRPKKPPQTPPSDTLTISHDSNQTQQDSGEIEIKPGEIHIDEQGNIISPQEVAQEEVVSQSTSPQTTDTLASSPSVSQISPAKAEIPANELNQESPSQPSTNPEIKPQPSVKPHELLDPANHKPSISPPFTADTQPVWYGSENSLPVDPLSEKSVSDDTVFGLAESPRTWPDPNAGLTSDNIVSSEPNTKPADLQDARSAVNEAMAAAPFNPAIEGPIRALNAQPLGESLHNPISSGSPQEGIKQTSRPAPPPVPPPIRVDSGVLISPPSDSPTSSAKTSGPTFVLPETF